MTPAATSAITLHSEAAAIRRKASESVLSIRARRDHAIAEATHGLDDVDRQLLAQPADEDLDGVGIAVEVLVVEVFDQLGARHHAVAMVHQVFEHAVFVGGELDRIAVDGHAAAATVEAEG